MKMNCIYKFKHWLQTKIYHACLNIKEEREQIELKRIVSQMAIVGQHFICEKNSSIIGAQYMEIGSDCKFGNDAWVACIDRWGNYKYKPHLYIGNRFNMSHYCHIGCVEKIEIGDNVLLGSKVYITDHSHGAISKNSLATPPFERPLVSKPVKIGNNVWIGDNVCIMPGVTLGDNVIVGANAVVTHSFSANVVVAGVPAQVIKRLL